MPEANSIPLSSNLIRTQEYFLHSNELSLTSFLFPCGGRGEGEGGMCPRHRLEMLIVPATTREMDLASYADKTPARGSCTGTI